MVTKKPATTASSQHKGVSAGPRAFDIIPRHQVKPSATSRPVITSTQPEQMDNTLKSAPIPLSTATAASKPAVSQLKHKPLNLSPSKDTEPAAASETVTTTPKGVKLADLLAAKQTAAEPESVSVSVTETDEPKLEPVAAETPEAEASAADAEPVAEEAVATDKDATVKDDTANAETVTTDEHEPDNVADKAKPATEGVADKPHEDSVDAILKEDKSSPQPHSQALKDELATIDKDAPDDPQSTGEQKDSEDGERTHHELYGGKPVIVIHKGHGHHSALNAFLWMLVCLLLAVVIVDVLLDMDLISLTPSFNIPHTNWF